jgi:hypothetical protein
MMEMLYTQQLEYAVRVNGHLSPYFIGVFAVNKLPKKVREMSCCGFIINTDTSNLPGTHWIAVYYDSVCRRGEVFDPFGTLPPTRLQLWMNNHCINGWMYNKTSVQGVFSFLCGHYCLYYLYYRLVKRFTMIDIIYKQLLASNNPDTVVRNFFLLNFA